MSGRYQALMRTRCPVCSTVFRVTSAQLRLKAGKVRCGHCQAIFNAFDQLQPEVEAPEVDAPLIEEAVAARPDDFHAEAEWPAAEVAPEPAVEAELEQEPEPEEPYAEAGDQPEPMVEPAVAVAPEEDAGTTPADVVVAEEASVAAEAVPMERELVSLVIHDEVAVADLEANPPVESPEESTQAAREAGLAAVRELNERPSYNRWAAGTLAGDDAGAFGGEPVRRAVWPFVLVAVALAVGLLGQLMYFFRTEIVLRLPATAALYDFVAIDVPLPRNASLVSIETSDLQSDNARGLFVLQATLKNRAAYAQAWPALELSLTDTNDSVVSRRVMFAADYLPPGTPTEAFPANGEIAVKLWIEAKAIGASGYRLYIFYP